ncbi:Protein phosphatase methylesterase 1 [Coemansia sp. RSA 552]|nr:Protein phosphatase methylesterase 1 [Coemansia sp. RSA 552]
MDLQRSIFKGLHPQLPSLSESGGSSGDSESTDAAVSAEFKPVPWTSYFETRRTVTLEDSTEFNIFASGLDKTDGPILLLHHGAGHSGLTFGLLAKYMSATEPGFTVVAPDARGHGDSGGSSTDLSLDQMVNDLAGIFGTLFPDNSRSVVLAGHSMGGAVVAHIARSKRIPKATGLVLIDIVEGSAMSSLHAIPGFITARPSSFPSLEAAIHWHIEAQEIQNPQSARLSVPSLVRKRDDGRWTWRTSLLVTEKFWRGWYEGLSKTFVESPVAKLLILAGSDRLDKELLISQMQGKFQLELLPVAGHTIQEDLPEQMGSILASFWKRNQPLNIPRPPA